MPSARARYLVILFRDLAEQIQWEIYGSSKENNLSSPLLFPEFPISPQRLCDEACGAAERHPIFEVLNRAPETSTRSKRPFLVQ